MANKQWQYATFYVSESGNVGTVEYSLNAWRDWDINTNEEFVSARASGLNIMLGLLGQFGWELVTTTPSPMGQAFILKRPTNKPARFYPGENPVPAVHDQPMIALPTRVEAGADPAFLHGTLPEDLPE